MLKTTNSRVVNKFTGKNTDETHRNARDRHR